MKRVSLEALLRRASRLAEKRFDKWGDVDPLWLIETEDGKQEEFQTPIVADGPLDAFTTKQGMMSALRRQFAEKKVCRYASVSECWASASLGSGGEESARRYAEFGYTLANAPDRKEVVYVEAVDDCEIIMAFHDIIRPAHGKPYLGKLGPIERPKRLSGTWTDLLPRDERAAEAISAQGEMVSVSVDPAIDSLSPELLARVKDWVETATKRKLGQAGHCRFSVDGVDYRAVYVPKDGKVHIMLMLESNAPTPFGGA